MSENNKNCIKNRHEIVFIYDVRDANPNGDPDDSNNPRIDENTGQNLVTDLRLKRTIRDYWVNKPNLDVFITQQTNEDGTRKSMDRIAKDFLIKIHEENGNKIENLDDYIKGNKFQVITDLTTKLPEKYIDVRAFGAAITLGGANTSITGAVQFGLGRSLNTPTIKTISITSSLASQEDKGQGSMGSYSVVDYSLIRFHGIVSEINAGKTGFNEEDLKLLWEGLWEGTDQLNTRSKFNHKSRLLIDVKMKEGFSQIGDLDLGLDLLEDNDPKSFDDVQINIDKFLKRISLYKDRIELISLLVDPYLKTFVKQENEGSDNGDNADKDKSGSKSPYVVKDLKNALIDILGKERVIDIQIKGE